MTATQDLSEPPLSKSWSIPTNDPKDAQDVGGKDDQQVDKCKQNEGNGDVSRPVEGLVGKHHLLNCSPYLFITEKKSVFKCFTSFTNNVVSLHEEFAA